MVTLLTLRKWHVGSYYAINFAESCNSHACPIFISRIFYTKSYFTSDKAETEDTNSSSDSSSFSEAYEQFKLLTRTTELGRVQFEASTPMQLLGLGKVKKGASMMDVKFKSWNER